MKKILVSECLYGGRIVRYDAEANIFMTVLLQMLR